MNDREAIPRTKDSALKVLLEHAIRLRGECTEEITREVLSDELTRSIFESAWSHQFERERGDFVRRCRELVRIEIDSVLEGKEDADS